MEYFDADCLCLRATDYKDNDKLLTLYAPEKGKIFAVAKGCKSPKAKLKYAASPLCFGHYYFSVKNGRFTLIGCDCYDSFFDMSQDIEKYCSAMTVVETLDKTQMEGQYDHEVYVHSLQTLINLKNSQEKCEEEVRKFLAKALILSGYKCEADDLRSTYDVFVREFGIKLNSLEMLINL
ncbi:MAG: DNA repair protein RecO [Eubacteriales bacterium]|nr:DNA repair protein RecO [Eubacteriales bacterium]